ncbi:hypothetical protein [Methylobacterium radiotolerans]|uniref:Uncharacterized protein n=1 Tax=Methylobacterium radiotolerans (strain ATCC 27329 / DSM 1819 / JCM 2831 / NBRC 15690 / NCIMB 10815 / 0-1) TaxID=426355 RepID=B1LW89_METRJ|nr:hypothetical protein [Methylobacterium radiotolerans]ACB27152.1 hypothetical protein Mrad2831_5195 [Methylobacterium radiotolerans JCM 2831]GEM98365.1 hypothetical protein MRA01_29050 [Methylobacterium radiotolerans]
MRPVSPLRLPPRLPPVARGACAVVHQTEAALPEPVAPAPAGDAPLQEVLAVEAAALADVADPAVLATARRDARVASLVADLDGVIARNPLDDTALEIDGQPAKAHERPRALGLRAARCGGAAARLRAYLHDREHPRHAELVDLHDRLYAEGKRLMAESRGLSA